MKGEGWGGEGRRVRVGVALQRWPAGSNGAAPRCCCRQVPPPTLALRLIISIISQLLTSQSSQSAQSAQSSQSSHLNHLTAAHISSDISHLTSTGAATGAGLTSSFGVPWMEGEYAPLNPLADQSFAYDEQLTLQL